MKFEILNSNLNIQSPGSRRGEGKRKRRREEEKKKKREEFFFFIIAVKLESHDQFKF